MLSPLQTRHHPNSLRCPQAAQGLELEVCSKHLLTDLSIICRGVVGFGFALHCDCFDLVANRSAVVQSEPPLLHECRQVQFGGSGVP